MNRVKKKKVVTFVDTMEMLSLLCIQEKPLLQFLQYLITMILVIILFSGKNKVRKNIKVLNKHFYLQKIYKTAFNKCKIYKSSLFSPWMFLKVHILQLNHQFTKNSCRIVTAITLHCRIIEITLLYG